MWVLRPICAYNVPWRARNIVPRNGKSFRPLGSVAEICELRNRISVAYLIIKQAMARKEVAGCTTPLTILTKTKIKSASLTV